MLTFQNYNEGIVHYFENIYDYVVYGNTSVAFKNAAMKFGDQVPLPLVSMSLADFGPGTLGNYSTFFRGETSNISENVVESHRRYPLNLVYQVDVWGSDEQQTIALYCELLFRTKEMPYMSVEYDGLDHPLNVDLLQTNIINNTDITQMTTRGRLYRYTIEYTVDNAYILKIEERDRVQVVVSFYDFNGKELGVANKNNKVIEI